MAKRHVMILMLFLSVMIFPMTIKAQYYADIKIDVNSQGLTSFSGNTNHPTLELKDSPDFTEKKGRYWTVNITVWDKFSTYIYELDLPQGAKVNYIKTPRISRIEDSGGKIHIIGTGEDQPFFVIVQYVIEPTETLNALLIVGLALFMGLITTTIIMFSRKEKKPKHDKIKLDSLTERQKQIYDIIRKNKGITQAKVEKMTGLPKSSLSRNIDSMVRKGIIIKEEHGMCNKLFLKKL